MSLFAAHRKQEGIGYVFHSIGDYVYHNFMRLPRSIIRYLILLKDILLPYFAAYHHHGYYPWVAAVFVSLLAYSYGFHVWILNFIIVVIGFAVGFLLVLLSGQHRPFKQFEGLQAVQKILTEKTELTVHRSYQSHKTVVSVNVDKAIQSIFDNLIRDYVLIWYQSINNDNAAFIDIISEQMWLVTENIVERLGNLDLVKLIYIDIVNKLCDHFKALRLSKLRFTSILVLMQLEAEVYFM
ncbi:Sorting nexin-25 [Trichoplax sp. H2]|nr:Sorting nexin-25 [Trichoplax sp. H2]|eukprot:RDD42298.1 Sorting nexin-25 [Trichoplax sp. H2]